MKRTFIFINENSVTHRILYIDEQNSSIIMGFIQSTPRYAKKFKYNLDIILNQQPTKSIFEKESITKDIDDVYAIKLFSKKGENIRIYCKCYDIDSGFHIVMAGLLEKKKTQKLTQKIKNIIKRVHNYEYDIK